MEEQDADADADGDGWRGFIVQMVLLFPKDSASSFKEDRITKARDDALTGIELEIRLGLGAMVQGLDWWAGLVGDG